MRPSSQPPGSHSHSQPEQHQQHKRRITMAQCGPCPEGGRHGAAQRRSLKTEGTQIFLQKVEACKSAAFYRGDADFAHNRCAKHIRRTPCRRHGDLLSFLVIFAAWPGFCTDRHTWRPSSQPPGSHSHSQPEQHQQHKRRITMAQCGPCPKGGRHEAAQRRSLKTEGTRMFFYKK